MSLGSVLPPSSRSTRAANLDPGFLRIVEASAVVAEAAGDRRMAKAQVKQNMGGAAAALEAFATPPRRTSSCSRPQPTVALIAA